MRALGPFRITVRRMMLVVALLAVGIAAVRFGLYARRHYDVARQMADDHAERRAISLDCARREKAGLDSPHFDGFSNHDAMPERYSAYLHQADYHERQRMHWESVRFRFWKSIRSEERADLADQPPDASWKGGGYLAIDEHGF